VEGYGCEPVFALAYVRHVNDKGNDLVLNYVSPHFQLALDAVDLSEVEKEEIISKVLEQGSCQHIEQLPLHIRNVFVVSSDVTADEHIYIQAALQRFVDNSSAKPLISQRETTKKRWLKHLN
jgi:ribonucleoside-diphosphate reductase alpha chain